MLPNNLSAKTRKSVVADVNWTSVAHFTTSQLKYLCCYDDSLAFVSWLNQSTILLATWKHFNGITSVKNCSREFPFLCYLGSALTLIAINTACKPGVQLCVTAEAVDTIVGLKRLIFFSLFVCLNSFVLIHIGRIFNWPHYKHKAINYFVILFLLL